MLSAKEVYSSVGEHQRIYLYKIFIETVPPALVGKFPQAKSFQSRVDLYNESAIFPNRKTDAIKISWSGEFFEIPGVDSSTRETDLVFYEDQKMWVNDFFDACKDFTGNEVNQAIVNGIEAKFNIGIAKVSVDKTTITSYKRLEGVRVYNVDYDQPSKGGTEVSKLKIGIRWDRTRTDKTKRGLML